jgi:Phospholipase_D-nuclease N-terminal
MFNDNGSFLLAMFEFFIFFAWIMCVFYVFADVFRSRDIGGVAKTVWCLFIIFLPFLGMLVYLIARGSGMTQRSLEQQQQMQEQQAAYVRSVAGTNGGGSSADQIAAGKTLLDEGTITQSEFDQMKAKALAVA